MSDNTYWVIFWIAAFSWLIATSYFEEQTKQIKIKSDLEIRKLREDTLRTYGKAVKEITERFEK